MPFAYIIVDTLITNDEEMEKYKLLAKPLVESLVASIWPEAVNWW